MSHHIKLLTSDDLTLCRGLLSMFGKAFEDPKAYESNPPSDAYLRALLAKPTFFALVAVDDDAVIGGLAGYVLEKFEQERSEAYIYDLAVDETYRRQGVATALIEALKPVARERGAYVIFVQADPPNEPAVKLYDRLGIREDVYHDDITG